MKSFGACLFLPLLALLLTTPDRAVRGDEDPPDLVQARTTYQKEVEFATRPIRDRYLSKLDLLKRSLGSRGDARGAVAVQDEIDQIKAAGGDPSSVSRFAGTWLLTYDVGSTRRYAIKADGLVTMELLNNTPPVPPRSAKIVLKGSDFVLDLGDGTLERISITGNKLSVEHFNPKALYPKSPPNYRATGVLAQANK